MSELKTTATEPSSEVASETVSEAVSSLASAVDDPSVGDKPVEDKSAGERHTRREWLLLGERVFSHTRYAVLIVAALALCLFDRYWFVLAPLALFFSLEIFSRIWLQKEMGWRNRGEVVFLLLDGIATLSLYSALLMPVAWLEYTILLRVARFFRGMYMLRMLRVFRFLTYETFVYSMPFAIVTLLLCGFSLAMPEAAIYIAVILLFEVGFRAFSVFKVLPDGGRRHGELLFLFVDAFAALSLLGLMELLPAYLILLRLLRFTIMLNPLGNLLLAGTKVAAIPEVRKETGMLVMMLGLLLLFASLAVFYLYPLMDINGDNHLSTGEYSPFQVILFVFLLLLDPGSAPAHYYTPWLALLTIGIVLSGVFFFALLVGLGSNIMNFTLRELSNSPLSPRVQLLFAGWNEKAIPILKSFDRLCVRLRRSYHSVWFFFGKPEDMAGSVGGWMSVREVSKGSRSVLSRFKLSGITQMIFFHGTESGKEVIIDKHALSSEACAQELGHQSMLISELELPEGLENVYRDAMNVDIFNSSSITARMLYQMHHCAYMPELGMRMLDAVGGETGLHSLSWEAEIRPHQNGARIVLGNRERPLEMWLTECFSMGLNILSFADEAGEFVLASNLLKTQESLHIKDIAALGSEVSLWPGIMSRAFDMDDDPQLEKSKGVSLKAYEWPETWELSMIFVGWHTGLPPMLEEMARKHHKLALHVLSPAEGEALESQKSLIKVACEHAAEQSSCELTAEVHAWDGLNADALNDHLRGCKVIMLYPDEQPEEIEDSILEMWFHSIARMLSARKAKVKWWTPPKLMVLPRDAGQIDTFAKAATGYPLLNIDVGSPDAFHDIYFARHLLSYARRHTHADSVEREKKSYEFMDRMLGDEVLVEGESSGRILEAGDVHWKSIYQDSLKRGWSPVAYILPERSEGRMSMFHMLDRAFPLEAGLNGKRIHLLAGNPIEEMDAPSQTATLLFCRRGVLNKHEEEALVEESVEESVEEEKPVEKEVATALNVESQEEKPIEKEQQEETALAENAMEGEIMQETVWPKTADRKLLRILMRQVEGALELLNTSTEDGLIKLTDAMDNHPGGKIEEDIVAALTDLQNIDRVSQRLTNVKSCLDDWSSALLDQDTGESVWKDELSNRYVMEEERSVMREEL